MTNESYLTKIKSMTCRTEGVFIKTTTVDGSEKRVEALEVIKADLEAALEAAKWLSENGFILKSGVFPNQSPYFLDNENFVVMVCSYASATYIEKLPVSVTDEEQVKAAQSDLWAKMSWNEEVIFVLKDRIKMTEQAIEKTKKHIEWLKAECEA